MGIWPCFTRKYICYSQLPHSALPPGLLWMCSTCSHISIPAIWVQQLSIILIDQMVFKIMTKVRFDWSLYLKLFDWAWCKNPPQQNSSGLPIVMRSIVLTVQPLSVRHLTWEVRKCSECHHSPPTTRQQFPHCFCFVAAADHHLGVNNQLSLDIYFQ